MFIHQQEFKCFIASKPDASLPSSEVALNNTMELTVRDFTKPLVYLQPSNDEIVSINCDVLRSVYLALVDLNEIFTEQTSQWF